MKKVERSYREWDFCGGCTWMVDRMLGSMIYGKNLKIHWGNRSLPKPHWIELKEFLHVHKVKSVLEYGAGLSTELMTLDGYDVTTLEPLEWYATLARKVHRQIHSSANGLPEFNRQFDCAVVDTPQGKGHRWKMINHALEYVREFMYLHDPEALQVEVLTTAKWNPMEDWSVFKGYHRFWMRGESVWTGI